MKLNIGGSAGELEGGVGSSLLTGFINVDMRPIRGVDVVADVRALPFDDESIEEIRASHVIEHFHGDELLDVVLEWNRVLTVGGLLRIYCPNAKEIAKRYLKCDISINKFSRLLFGNQTYAENYHRVAIDRIRLDTLVMGAGFVIIGRDPRPKAYVYDLGVQAVKE